jgi:hypothetical protein
MRCAKIIAVISPKRKVLLNQFTDCVQGAQTADELCGTVHRAVTQLQSQYDADQHVQKVTVLFTSRNLAAREHTEVNELGPCAQRPRVMHCKVLQSEQVAQFKVTNGG